MSEERHPGNLLESRPSSARVALGMAGVVFGLGLLVCGGVAGYVALTTTGPAVVERHTPTEDRSSIESVAEKIIAIDLPAGFEPYHSEKNTYMKVAEFARKGSDAASLVLGRADLSAIPVTSPDEAQSTLLNLMDHNRRHDTALMTVVANAPHSTREFTVLQKPVPFQFVDGTVPDGTLVRRASGTFRTREAYIAVVYTVPAAEFDEKAFSKLLESIRPAADDSTVDAAAGDDAESPAGESSEAANPDGSK